MVIVMATTAAVTTLTNTTTILMIAPLMMTIRVITNAAIMTMMLVMMNPIINQVLERLHMLMDRAGDRLLGLLGEIDHEIRTQVRVHLVHKLLPPQNQNGGPRFFGCIKSSDGRRYCVWLHRRSIETGAVPNEISQHGYGHELRHP